MFTSLNSLLKIIEELLSMPYALFTFVTAITGLVPIVDFETSQYFVHIHVMTIVRLSHCSCHVDNQVCHIVTVRRPCGHRRMCAMQYGHRRDASQMPCDDHTAFRLLKAIVRWQHCDPAGAM